MTSAGSVTHFHTAYGYDPAAVFSSPGRVNLIGEHTDYTGGLVLPFAIDARAYLAAAPAATQAVRITSAQKPGEIINIDLDDIRPGHPSAAGWAGYLLGAMWALKAVGYDIRPIDLALDSQVPSGAGLSSSAAIECATVLAAAQLSGHSLDPELLARIAQRAENEFVGVPCGPMDQTASAACEAGSVLLFDTDTGDTESIPFDPEAVGLSLLVIDTRVAHSLADGEYGKRQRSCEQATELLQIRQLRDLGVDDLGPAFSRLPTDELCRRVRHVVTENDRVTRTVRLLRQGRIGAIGDLLLDSHRSLRDDFEVSCAELDHAVRTAVELGAVGARMTGGGFGGSVIALAPTFLIDPISTGIVRSFADQGFAPPVVRLVAPAHGATWVPLPASSTLT